MSEITIKIPAQLPAGLIVATDVTEQEYLATYAEDFHEWVNGVVIKMTPASYRHDLLTTYLRTLFDTYFSFNPIGKAVSAPFVMRVGDTVREPDVQVILNDNPGEFTDTGMKGPADICIEVVSPESGTRDRGEKFGEYEQAGVTEYWIIDPIRKQAEFYRLSDAKYVNMRPDSDNRYRTPLLPEFFVDVSTLWEEHVPGPVRIVEMVKEMLGE